MTTCQKLLLFVMVLTVHAYSLLAILTQIFRKPLSTNIDGFHGDNDIVSMWKQHYAAIFNSVENSSCDQAHSDFCNTNIAFDNAMTVDLFEMKAVIDDLASNKSPGLDGLSAEHFKFAHSRLLALLSTLVSSIVVHGHVPHCMNESVIVPIIGRIRLVKFRHTRSY